MEELLNLVNNLEESETKKGIVSELTKIKAKLDNNKINTLSDILDENNEQFAGLRKEFGSHIDSIVGKNRTKWEKEVEEKNKKVPPIKKEDDKNELLSQFKEILEPLQKQVVELTGQKKIQDNKNLTIQLMKERKIKEPETMLELIHLTSDMSKDDIVLQIEKATEIAQKFGAKVTTETENGNPEGGEAGKGKVSAEVKDILEKKKSSKKSE